MDVIKTLLEIENEKNVFDWKWSDIAIWPIIKVNLFFSWYDKPNEKKETVQKQSLVKVIFKTLKIISYICWQGRKIKVIYAGFNAHRTLVNNKFVSKFFGPIKKKDYLEIEYGKIERDKLYDNSKNILFLEYLEPLIKMLRFGIKNKWSLDDNVREFLEVYNKKVTPLPENYKALLEGKLHLVYIYSLLFSILLRLTRVKQIYILCYYNIQMFGLVHAANKLGILTYDVQHGSQGVLHPMYVFNGLKSGVKYPNTLPSNFWCWDEASVASLRNWLPVDRQYNVENKGNPWIDFTIRHYNTHFKNAIDRKKHIILITLQEPILSETILELIQRLDSCRFVWWLRFHPRMMEKREYWKDYFLRAGIKNVEIDKACEIPLPILLKSSFLHISRYSGSIIEGCILGTRTFITDEIGIETFGHYVDGKQVFNAVDFTSDELLQLIENLTKV